MENKEKYKEMNWRDIRSAFNETEKLNEKLGIIKDIIEQKGNVRKAFLLLLLILIADLLLWAFNTLLKCVLEPNNMNRITTIDYLMLVFIIVVNIYLIIAGGEYLSNF